MMATGGAYTNNPENIVYYYNGITDLEVTGLFATSAEPISNFKFFVSAYGFDWTEMTGWTNTDTLINYDTWTKRVYSLTDFPTWANYIRVEFPQGGTLSWNPQLGRVKIWYGSSSLVTDDLDDWTKCYKHSRGLVFDTANATELQDSSRAKRTNNTPAPAENIVYNYTGITDIEATALFATASESIIVNFKFFTSSDGIVWKQHTEWTKTDTLINYDTWVKRVYSFSSVPSGTNYVKIEFPTGGENVWNPQLGQVKL